MNDETYSGEKPSTKRPRTRRGCEEDYQKFRAEILATAKNIYQTHGIEKLTIRALANELSISPMLVYHYFADKVDLIIAMWDEILEQAFNFTFEHTEGISDVHERIRVQNERCFEFWENNPEKFRLVFLTDVSKCKRMETGLTATKYFSMMAAHLYAPIRELAQETGASEAQIDQAQDLRSSMLIGYLYASVANTHFPRSDLAQLRATTLEAISICVDRILNRHKQSPG
ncbi:MAG: TetR/AcrR family transcriptional regulator [Paludibacterium sp.]|uniref:TetR/AcrR family transcriptional regulator n=1 Tax=Paludibacterium sp. TaxID=1917523 RepID=UPI0025FA3372|nr:TetR/AcrR family transcriptional regulator [Paludibacterium sp.]MBV8047392.1 TetR/AcrR family transcriptional regulator [Paludibacterium sp.]MBV8646853.1 TetR/AcrR family transcriptional regulator [Paludibacterium sp.]